MTTPAKPLTPIERMIDAACGYNQDPKRTAKEIAESAAQTVLGHIDQMYPAMWNGVTKNARRSLRGCVFIAVTAALKEFER